MNNNINTILAAFFLLLPLPLAADGVTFKDISLEAGINYQRVPSARNEIWEAIKAKERLKLPDDALAKPVKAQGIPGVAILDFDRDGDLDIYVTNGPGAANSLYASQLNQTGALNFIDVGVTAGVGAIAQDSSGVTFGDIDNDGDLDLYVLGTGEGNLLFENNGDGTFKDITVAAGVEGGALWSSSACMGDINGDGLLDIYVGNAGDLNSNAIIRQEPFALNEHNQLFVNLGDNRFQNISQESGIEQLAALPEGAAGMTWAVAMVDYDLDGDVDIFSADDQANFSPSEKGGFPRGIIHLWQNDGQGHFIDVAISAGTDIEGPHMGLTFADYNHDGHLDFFVSNTGSYNDSASNTSQNNRLAASKWLLADGKGGFIYPGLGPLMATPFGWGAASADYDNDGDTDIIFHGAIEFPELIMLSNPGTILSNDGNAVFDYDGNALLNSTDHNRRLTQGMAIGDLDANGYIDIVSVSSFDIPSDVALTTWSARGGVMDSVAKFIRAIVPGSSFGSQVYNPVLPAFLPGSLSIEINQGGNNNTAVSVQLLGTAGLTSTGKVNRDGIGAVVIWTPKGGRPVMHPVMGGAGFASQDALNVHLGLGQAESGDIEVIWPGGVRSQLFNIQANEKLLLPEFPVSFDDQALSLKTYLQRAQGALETLRDKGLLNESMLQRLMGSAKMAWFRAHLARETL